MDFNNIKEMLKKITVTHILLAGLVGFVLYLIYHCLTFNETTKSCVGCTDSPTGTEDNKNTIICYYATWCGYSRSFLPEWEKFTNMAKTSLPELTVTKVKCEGEKEKDCSQKGVQGYPSIILYLADGTEQKFNGDRTTSELINFCKKNIK